MKKDAQEQLLNHLDSHFGITTVREEGFGITANEYVEYIVRKGGKRLRSKTALTRLNHMVENDNWKVAEMIDYDGKKRNVYWSE